LPRLSSGQNALVKRWLPIAAVVGALLAGCGDDGDAAAGSDPPEAAIVRQLGYLSDAQYGRLYDELHPAQQALLSRDEFIQCYSDEVPALTIEDIDIGESFEESLTLPGTDQRVDTVALTTEFSAGGSQDTTTFHEIEVDGEWRWMLQDPSICGV
jgi:hypothetical protein